MINHEYLTMEQINILLKCYYLKKYSKVAEDENLTAERVKRIKDNALRTIQLAYSKSHIQGIRFEGEAVLQHMAVRSNMTTEELSIIFDGYITLGLASETKKYWK